MYGLDHNFSFSSLIAVLLTLFPGLSSFFPGTNPPPPADRIAPVVRVERPRGDVFDRDESLLRLGGIEVRATDNVRVTGVTVELLRFSSATATTPNGFYNFTTRTFVTSTSAATQTTATATANPAILRAAAGNIPQLTVGTTYAVRARARDAAGNTSTDVSRFTRRAGFSATQTRITGRITNSNGTAVAGVLVRSSVSTVPVRTDANGRYELVNISRTGDIVVTPDPVGGTFSPVSRTVVVTSTSQGEIGNINFIRTGPPVAVNVFRPGTYRVEFSVIEPDFSHSGTFNFQVNSSGQISPVNFDLFNEGSDRYVFSGTVGADGRLNAIATETSPNDGPNEALVDATFSITLTNQNGQVSGGGNIIAPNPDPGTSSDMGDFTVTKIS